MKKQISKDTLERYLSAVETAVKCSFPINSSIVNNLNEIKRLALKGYELELASQSTAESQSQLDRVSVNQLGIR